VVDIHCHIVPGVDDGAVDRAMSLAMLEEAKRQGITAIATTPHFVPGSDDQSTLGLHQARLTSIGIASGIELMLSREVRVNASLVSQSTFGELTYGGKGQYILLELPSNEVPTYLDRLLFTLRLDGVIPIIAHPERNMALLHDPRKVIELLRAGAHLQLTTSSISGGLGPTIEAFSASLLTNRLVSFVASDAHNLTSRPFTDWAPAIETMHTIGLTEQEVAKMTTTNPQAVFDSIELSPLDLVPAVEKAFLNSASNKPGAAPTKRKRFFFF
jgi:protein-tyrosine phosphatase